MFEYLTDFDTIIVPTKIKEKILKDLTLSKKLLNIKFYTLEEFIANYFGTYDERAIYFLVKNYNLNYDIAKSYLDNIYFDYEPLKEIHDTLESNNLLIKNDLFKQTLSNIKVIGYNLIDPYLKKELSKYNTTYIDIPSSNYTPVLYGFDKENDCIAYLATSISDLLSKVPANKIYLVNVNEDSKRTINRIFKAFNIPININNTKKIYSTKTVSLFLEALSKNKNIEDALNILENNDIKNKIIDIINKYYFVKDIDETYINIIKCELKKATIKTSLIENALNIIDINDINDPDNYYYIINFNQGMIPKLYQDDQLIKDKLRPNLGLLTSLEKLLIDTKTVTKTIHSYPHITLLYKLKDNYQTYYKSPLIDELNLKEIHNPEISLEYSDTYNQLLLASSLDKLIKYNEHQNILDTLYNTYPNIPYLQYNNAYQQVDFNDLNTYLKGKTNLSYSSMNNYYLCAFRFYIENILKLDPFEDTFAAFLGSLFHDCLSHMYDPSFDLKSNYESYLTKRELTSKERFFCHKLYKNLEAIIDTIHYQEKFSQLNETLTEQHISISKVGKLNVNFLGFVDKIKYQEKDNQMLLAIIDYKTGYVETTLDNINYGLHLQLPVYIYLTKKGLHKNIKIVGFYLQKILNNVDMDIDSVKDDIKSKLRLEGYSIDNEELINKLDSTYAHSEVIKGMSLTQKGFAHYTKLVSEKDIDTIANIVDSKINETIKSIEETNFPINPKRINNKLIGCEFCHFKDLCYKKEEDIIDLEYTKKETILGGEQCADMD